MTRLILASQSPARTKLLTDAGIRHTVLVSDVDEDAVQARYGVTDPHDTALLLARAKAEAVAALPEAEGALVLGLRLGVRVRRRGPRQALHGRGGAGADAPDERSSRSPAHRSLAGGLPGHRPPTTTPETLPDPGPPLARLPRPRSHFLDMDSRGNRRLHRHRRAAAVRRFFHHRRPGRGLHPQGRRRPARRRRPVHFHPARDCWPTQTWASPTSGHRAESPVAPDL